MKITIELDTSDDNDKCTAETYQMSAETRSACREALKHIRDRIKNGNLDFQSIGLLQAVRCIIMEELNGWEP